VVRRRFDHLHVELSVAVGQLVPRYALWLYLQERGWDPDRLSRSAAISFSREHIHDFLSDCELTLGERAARRLTRALERFDPRYPTPDEVMTRLFSPR